MPSLFANRFIPSIKAPLALLALSLCLTHGLSARAADDAPPAWSALPESVGLQELEGQAAPGAVIPSADPEKPAAAPAIMGSEAAPLEAKAVVVDIVSDTLNYDTAKNIYTATGAVHVIVSEQNSELIADKVVYDPAQELMIAEGHVVINNKGSQTFGAYAKIDLTRKSALITSPITRLEEVRIKAEQAFVGDKVVELKNGVMIIPAKNAPNPTIQANARKAMPDDLAAGNDDLSQLDMGHPLLKSGNSQNEPSPEQLERELAAANQPKRFADRFYVKARSIEVTQNETGYNDINIVDPRLKFGSVTLARLPQMDFSQDESTGDVEYLGPDIGVDPDYGGFYFGPGWDFRLGKGIVKFSPVLSYGVGSRRKRGGQDIENVSGPGVGGILHYMSHTTQLNMGYNAKVGSPVIFGERKLFDGKTRLMVGANEDYNQGFLGWERPKYIAQITDSRKLYEKHNVRLTTFGSLGVAHDEFFPTNQEDFFVTPKDPESEPVTAGRMQLQASISNVLPMLTIGNEKKHLDFGLGGQVALAGYTTGDFIGVFRAGPSARLTLGDRFTSYNRYFYAATAGETPFVFDTYYRGRNNIQSTNQFRVNKFLTLGLRSNMSLNRDNSQNALFTGNSVFMLVGPDDLKLNLAYDFVRQRSFFGINMLPGRSTKTVRYDSMKIYQPEDFGEAPTATPVSQNTLGGVEDVGMMNGGRAR